MNAQELLNYLSLLSLDKLSPMAFVMVFGTWFVVAFVILEIFCGIFGSIRSIAESVADNIRGKELTIYYKEHERPSIFPTFKWVNQQPKALEASTRPTQPSDKED